MNKDLFKSVSNAAIKATDTVNNAGGKAYSLEDKAALAQMVMTGTFNGTFYCSAEDQLKTVLELANKLDAEFVAKLAVHARQKGYMKDAPAVLAAVVASKDTALLTKIFPQVINDPKMFRNFIKVIRSGATGRKSFGTAPKRLLQNYLSGLTDEQLFRASIGNDPSLADCIKLVRPKPADDRRSALHAYLLDKEYKETNLLPLARAYEDFKKTLIGEVPDVPFQMLTALPLTETHWKIIAEDATWTQTRMNLNSFLRHGVFKDPTLVTMIANRLENEDLVKRAHAFPYQLFAAFKNIEADMPAKIVNSLQKAAELSIQNIPEFDGQVYVLTDISGSMKSPVTGMRGSATTKVSCLDVAALVSAAILRKNPEAKVIPFSDHVVPASLNPLDSIMTNATKLASLPSGGTNCSAPLIQLNQQKAKGDLVIYVSDNESWVDSGGYRAYRGTATMQQWQEFKKRNPKAKLVCIDVTPNATTQAQTDNDILNIGGFSDNIFEVIKMFTEYGNSKDLWVKTIEAIEI